MADTNRIEGATPPSPGVLDLEIRGILKAEAAQHDRELAEALARVIEQWLEED